MTTILISCDSMKGSASAADFCRWIADGWTQIRPSDTIALYPMADGGEGTVEAIAHAPEQRSCFRSLDVSSPNGSVPAASRGGYLVTTSRSGYRTAIVELATNCGIELLDKLIPHTASTRGLGDAIRAAALEGVDEIIVTLGSSASTDGGAGLLQALGVSLKDAHGEEISPGLAGLQTLEVVDTSHLIPLPKMSALVDVTNPLTGDTGAAAVFGPQKGLTGKQEIAKADRALARFADVLNLDPATPGAGAAGGAGAAMCWLGAELTPGAEKIFSLIGAADTIADCDYVITGEGRYDQSSLAGKVPSQVAVQAEKHHLPWAIVAGVIDTASADMLAPDQLVALADLAQAAGRRGDSLHTPRPYAIEAGRILARGVRFSPAST